MAEPRLGSRLLLLVLIFGWLGLAGRGWSALALARPAPPTSRVAALSLYESSGEEAGVTLLFTGDVMLARGVAAQPHALADVAPELAAADLAVGNLEGVFAAPDGGEPLPPAGMSSSDNGPPRGYRLEAPPAAVQQLQNAGFDLLSVANNHALDGGPRGRAATIERLQRLGLTPLGANPGQAVYRTVRGVRVAFLAFNQAPTPEQSQAVTDRAALLTSVSAADRQADVVVVLMHWGAEYAPQADAAQIETAHALVEAGADLIVGSHPHVLQGTQVIPRADGTAAFVAYSLGNFVFDQGDVATRHGAALRVVVNRAGLHHVEALPVYTYLQARWVEAEGAEVTWLHHLTPPGQPLAYACDAAGCREVAPPEPTVPNEGVFSSGRIDLTGDGQAERITLEGGRVSIYSAGARVWQNPEDWTVYDVALGDPNDDGRFEAVVVFDKIDTRGRLAGRRASHPFLMGFRNGQYAEVWGGSAVADPIRAVEVGDMDGDGRQDLVVLEERCGAPAGAECEQRSAAVWRWNGWGFSLFWRSPADALRDLRICAGPDGGRPQICVRRGWE